MSSEGKYTNIEYQNFFEKNLSDTDPDQYLISFSQKSFDTLYLYIYLH